MAPFDTCWSQVCRHSRIRAEEARQKTQAELERVARVAALGELVTSIALTLAHGELKRSGVVLQTRLANDLPLIMGDRIQLQQLILNLLINAIEAMNRGGEGLRQLSVSSEKVTAIPGDSDQDRTEASAGRENVGPFLAEAEPPHVLVSVADTGPGLDPDALNRLFKAFYTTKSQGLGMGLAISPSIVEAHGGRLWARANVPKGALFQFTLPIHKE